MPGAKPTRTDTATMADPFSGGIAILQNLISASQTYMGGMLEYTNSFYTPYLLATQYFQRVEALRLLENPPALNELVILCGASPWIADQMARHPVLLDELLENGGTYSQAHLIRGL